MPWLRGRVIVHDTFDCHRLSSCGVPPWPDWPHCIFVVVFMYSSSAYRRLAARKILVLRPGLAVRLMTTASAAFSGFLTNHNGRRLQPNSHQCLQCRHQPPSIRPLFKSASKSSYPHLSLTVSHRRPPAMRPRRRPAPQSNYRVSGSSHATPRVLGLPH